ncbi:MAG: hypothetical protein Q7J32_12205 [Sphingomonadaceae bacterium]|nr:hypothetical protein [Sphingomonadaceae bacterium]
MVPLLLQAGARCLSVTDACGPHADDPAIIVRSLAGCNPGVSARDVFG